MVENNFWICLWYCCFSIHFKLRRRGLLSKNLSRTTIFERYSRSVKRVSSPLRFVLTKEIAMYNSAIVNEREKNVKKNPMKMFWNTKNIIKYFNLLKFYILDPNYEVKSSNWQDLQQKGYLKLFKTEITFYYPNWQGTQLIINYSLLLT